MEHSQQRSYQQDQQDDQDEREQAIRNLMKRKQLQSRLYDSGISNIPMPSVKRPIEDKISAKPFSARMNSSKIQSVSSLKKKIQGLNTDIIKNLNESYKEAAVQEAKYKGEGTADYYKQQQIVIPAPQYINTSTAGRKLQGSLGVPQAGQPRYAQNLFNRKTQLPPLDEEYQSNAQANLSQTRGTVGGAEGQKIMSGPPSLVYAGFEGGESMSQKNLEQARCKFLLDKLTGKLPEEMKNTHLDPIDASDAGSDAGSRAGSGFKDRGLGKKDEDAEDPAEGEKKKPQQWSELDKFIELLLDSKSDEETVFLYLNQNENNDPYDLRVTTYKDTNKDKHFTLSSKGITVYEQKQPIEFLSLGQWLIERDSYNHIKTYQFFKQFKKWKFMRMWKKTIKHQNRVKAMNHLEENLFILNDNFRVHLMKHRELMLDMSNKVRFVDTCMGMTTDINQFETMQMNSIKKSKKSIMEYSGQSRQNIEKCIDKVLNELRNQIMDDMSMDEDRKKQSPVGGGNTMSLKKKESNNVFDKLGFPSGMTYGHRSSLRKQCLYFLKFAFLVDFISLDALAKIYCSSVAKMIDRLKDLNDSIDIDKILKSEMEEEGGGMTAGRGSEPLFYVNVEIEDSKPIPETAIEKEPIDDFIKSPRGKSQTMDFDLLAHVQLQEENEEEEEEDDGGEKEAVHEQLFKQTVPKIHEYWITLVPDKKQFIDRVLNTFTVGLKDISYFERWGKHKDLQDYADALEEWDEMAGDVWDEPESMYLDPQPWIIDKPISCEKEHRVTTIINDAFDKSKTFIKKFQVLLEIYWRNKQFDMSYLVDERLKQPVDTLAYTIELFQFYMTYFRENLPQQTDIGLLQIDSRNIKQKLQPTPKQYETEIQKLVPRINKERTEEAREWVSYSKKQLGKAIHSVEDFVEQTNALVDINKHFQDYRDKVDLYETIRLTIEQHDLNYDRVDRENLKQTDIECKNLQQQIQDTESAQPEMNARFKKELEQLIPALNEEIEALHEQSKNPCYLEGESNMKQMIEQLDAKEDTFKGLEARAEKYNNWQAVLETNATQFDNLDALKEDLGARCLLWRSLRDWQAYTSKALETNFQEIEAEDVKLEAERYAKDVARLQKTLEDNPIQRKLKDLVDTFRGAMPIVVALRRPQLEANHWEEINELVGQPIDIAAEGFTLQSLVDMNVVPYQEEIEAIAVRAMGEAKLNTAFAELEAKWKGCELIMETYKEREGVYQLKYIDDLYECIDDCLAQINMILGNRFVGFMRKVCEKMKKEIQNANAIVTVWVECQREWMYLENIFTQSKELISALPNEKKMFDAVNVFFIKEISLKAQQRSRLVGFVKLPKITEEAIKGQVMLLGQVRKGLESYMEQKRDAFPRFYFLSDDEVLEILAKSDQMDIIQQYLKQMFDGIVKVTIENESDITQMRSKEGEAVPLSQKVKVSKEVDVYLDKLQEMMVSSLQKQMKNALSNYMTMDRKDWVMDKKHYGQCIATVAQIKWSEQTEFAIQAMADDDVFALNEHYDLNQQQIEALTILVRGNLEDLQRQIIVALITTDVHARDIVGDLRTDNVCSIYDFQWQKQLRYYWVDETQDAKVQQIQATLMYAYEYMGATTRLVITPLTDKCWVTITGALHIQLGANPAGPAGTGKTESTKDLAKAIAIYCVVYNCSDQVVYLMMQRHFKGLAQQGCWTCLDEFNRIEVEVLSVIASQLLTIRNGLIANPQGTDSFDFEGSEIKLKTQFGCHVTMNPGYAGRTELPDNLKVLFRPVAMMIPDYQLIAQIMLYSEGFGEAAILSHKMRQLYKLASEQLSQQSHYDFGMRAVKSVLVQAGMLKRAPANLDKKEDEVLIRAMCDANIPKFLTPDVPLFNAIVQDLFPKVVMQETDYSDFNKEVTKSCKEFSLQPHPVFLKKVTQLQETFSVRFGVMLVGTTGGGKTRCYEVLADLMTRLRNQNHADKSYQVVNMNVLNPKAISMDELYGSVDKDTNEWCDGLVSKLLRNAANLENEDRDWTVFDGPVDAIWIENMNTVLDDNMTLCLANGQRLKLRPQMRMLFEVNDLAVASPATVSRCGMVYLTPEDMSWRPYVQTWIANTFPESDANPVLDEGLKLYLWETFDATVDEGIAKIRAAYTEPVKTDNLQLAKNLCALLSVFLGKGANKGFTSLDPKQRRKDLDSLFAWSYAWALGGALNEQSKDYFDTVVKDKFKGVSFPPAYTVFDYFYELKKEKTFKSWESRVEPFVYDKETAYFDLFVQTSDTYKHRYVLELLLEIEKPVFFTGETGVGKTSVIANTLDKLSTKNVVALPINFSAQTDSKRTQQSIEEKLEKSRVRFCAPPGKKVAIFVDDINMPATETYGAQPPIELLRMLVDRQGVFDRAEWEWKRVEDCTLVACAAPPTGGRSVITQRLTTHFAVLCMPGASQTVLDKIFKSILDGFLKTGFTEPIQATGQAIVNSTVEVYNRIAEELRPTPAKFHYTFNLRDVSKVIQGVLMSAPVSIQAPDTMAKLWANEAARVFHDRLTDDADREWFVDLAMDLLSREFRSSMERDDLFGASKVMVGDLLRLDAPKKLYEVIADQKKLYKQLNYFLDELNMSSSNRMNLVFFEDAILHCLRIARVLRQSRGSLMLIGMGGSGKQSLIRMSSFMYEMSFRQLEIVKGFNSKLFRERIKEMMFDAALRGVKIAFAITDSMIIDESFLEDLNNMLNTGEIPNLMLPEDKEAILGEEMRKIVTDRKLIDTAETLQAVFVDRVREFFHICLCMSPVGDTLRLRVRQFPSLVNCCTIDWFSAWPREALLFVSTEFLADLELPSEEVRTNLAEMCASVHVSVKDASARFDAELRRKIYTTPKSYLDLISLYINKLADKRLEHNSNRDRLAIGLKKLGDTKVDIDEFKVKLAEAAPQLKIQSETLNVQVEVVVGKQKLADEQKKLVQAEAEIVGKKASDAGAIEAEAKTELDAAEPEVKRAKAALNAISAKDLVELKSAAKQLPGTLKTMQVVFILAREENKAREWAYIKNKIGNPATLLKELVDYDVDKHPEKAFTKVRKDYINDPDWTRENVAKLSVCAANLYDWCIATVSYQALMKKIKPKMARLKEVKEIADSANAELKQKKDQLQAVLDEVQFLNDDLNAKKATLEDLEATIERCTAQLGRAEALVVLLADEGIRWKATCESLQVTIDNLVGDVFLSCACISYYGGFTGDYRLALTDQWAAEAAERAIPTSEGFSLCGVMGDPVTIRGWNICGLPSDSTSAENGILTTMAERWGLCIDPQQQANRWLKSMLKGDDMLIQQFGKNANFLREVSGAVRNGKPLLVEDVEERIDPGIDPLLLKQQFVADGGVKQIKLGESVQDYDDGFRLFMTTKMANPHYPPEVCIKVTLINFTVTFKGLEEQLLGDAVLKERPEVEKQRDDIVVQMDRDNRTLKKQENDILAKLAKSTKEQILDEDTLIDMLKNSKKVSAEIEERIESSAVIQVEIKNTRAQYVPVAVRGSIIYFVVADLANINAMYQNSLQYVKVLFNKAIDNSPPAEGLEERLENIIDTVTKLIYTNIARGLFEKDKLVYSFLLATSIRRQAGIIDAASWNHLLRGAMPFTKAQAEMQPENPAPALLPVVPYGLMYSLEINETEVFAGLTESIRDNLDKWTEWAKCDKPHVIAAPCGWQERLTPFQRLLLLKCFRPEKLLYACQDYVRAMMGQFYVESIDSTMATIYKDTDYKTPLIFVLSVGADPMAELQGFAEKQDYTHRMKRISLGQGQGQKAKDLVAASILTGDWVVLQNCHLAGIKFMPDLEAMVAGFAEQEVDPAFRLYLTSAPSEAFPVSVLQVSVKLTTEPPRGLRANLRRTYLPIDDEYLDSVTKKNDAWHKLNFGLAFFHAVAQERRKFGALGWNNLYEFNDSDLMTSTVMLKNFIAEQDELPWDAMHYVTGEINYGGRVTDAWDVRLLGSQLRQAYCEETLVDGYLFSDSGKYYAPPIGKVADYRKYIDELPLVDDPEVFGLHDNANIVYQTNESAYVIDTVLSIQPRVGGASTGPTPDEIVLARQMDILQELPEPLDRETGKKDLFKEKNGLLASLTTVLLLEMEKYNRLIEVMKKSLLEIERAIGGYIVMSETLDSMYVALQNGKVPANWSSVGFLSLKPLGPWYAELQERVVMFRNWLVEGPPNAFWLSGFFFPQGFMTGCLQTHARQHKIPIDKLTFAFEIMKEEGLEDLTEPPEEGMYIYGMYMDGARWNREDQVVDDQFPSILYDRIPCVHFAPKVDYKIDPDQYTAPLYKTSERKGTLSTTGQSTNFVIGVQFPTKASPDVWVRRAAALLCNLNE